MKAKLKATRFLEKKADRGRKGEKQLGQARLFLYLPSLCFVCKCICLSMYGIYLCA